jgi:hypothetical protein
MHAYESAEKQVQELLSEALLLTMMLGVEAGGAVWLLR